MVVSSQSSSAQTIEGGGGPPVCVCSIDVCHDGWIQKSVTIEGTAPAGTTSVSVDLNLLADGFTCLDACGGGAPGVLVGTEMSVPVGSDCRWKVTFTQGVNAFSPFICDDSLLGDGFYQVNVSCGACCCFWLDYDCYVPSFACCDECWYDEALCPCSGYYPGHPGCPGF